MEDVARVAGVSVATVSKVVNHRYGVAQSTIEKVTEALEYAGVTSLAEPTLDAGESLADFMAADDGFDSDKAAERDYGFVRLNQLAIEHLVG